jgi:hypothetical protein
MAKEPSTQSVGRAKTARKAQGLVRQKMLGKAKQKADALQSSEESSWRYKDAKTGKTFGYQSEQIYKGTGPGDSQRGTDKYVSTKRRTTSKMKKK